ncbi:MAG: endonuclease III domain-containing protein [Candidatus Micrarchaeia archaeon]
MPAPRLLDPESARKAVEIIEKSYKDAKYYLNFSTPVDLLAAAILSAQTKDSLVNSITPELFKRFKDASDYVKSTPEELMEYISKVSYARKKAENIIEAFKIIEKDYGGKVPSSKPDLVKLPGVGEKTANTILINAYGIVEGIPVDTWVIKLSYRIGFSLNKNPDKIEEDLKKVVDKAHWHNFAYMLKAHGKALCGTIPKCSECPLRGVCAMNGVTKSK